LLRLDAQAAQKISGADEQKLIRAIEVCLITKKPLTNCIEVAARRCRVGACSRSGWRPTAQLCTRGSMHARTQCSLTAGLRRSVLARSRPAGRRQPFDFIGYRELRDVLQGRITMDDATAAIQQSTRRYAKRQFTWFRREPIVHWLAGFGDHANVQRDALAWLQSQHAGQASA